MNIVTVKPNRASSVRRNDVGNAVILCLAGVLTRNLQKKKNGNIFNSSKLPKNDKQKKRSELVENG